MRPIRLSLLIVTVFVVQALLVSAETPQQILSNSEDWQDVYSAMQYGTLASVNAQFLVSNRHATLILNSIPTNSHLWVFSSKNVPYVVGYDNLLQGRGYSVEEFEDDNLNLFIGGLLEDVTNFIVIDDAYGYNAISVAPYAAVTNSYVLFADEDSINDITDFLESREVTSILIYGQVDREVINALAPYSPEVINRNGDRFENNVEIVKRYQERGGAKQVILTNGEFIEQEIMTGSQPVIFIGTNNVPDVTRDYVQNSEIDVGVLIGNELVGTATFVRRQLGISVFVKFAQGARSQRGAISQVEALDMFYLPVYTINLALDAIKYNRATNKLEVTIRNTEDQAAFFTGTYSLTASDNSRQAVGDEEPIFIDGNDAKTLVYDVKPMPEGNIVGDIFIIYGESPGSLEREIRERFEIESVTVLDSCDINLQGLEFNLRKKEFAVSIENIGSVACHVDAELIDVVVAGQKTSFGAAETIQLRSGEVKQTRIKVSGFEEEDLEDNERIKVRAFYGERETSLVKVIEGTFEVVLKKGDMMFYTLLIVIVLLLILVIWRRRKKDGGQTQVQAQHQHQTQHQHQHQNQTQHTHVHVHNHPSAEKHQHPVHHHEKKE